MADVKGIDRAATTNLEKLTQKTTKKENASMEGKIYSVSLILEKIYLVLLCFHPFSEHPPTPRPPPPSQLE